MSKVALVVVGIALAVGAPAIAEGDAFRGKAFSEAMCSSCHATGADATASPEAGATPFPRITLEQKTGEDLATWLNTKHPLIPNTVVQARHAEDILTFIASIHAS